MNYKIITGNTGLVQEQLNDLATTHYIEIISSTYGNNQLILTTKITDKSTTVTLEP
jgi:hypothetical protein